MEHVLLNSVGEKLFKHIVVEANIYSCVLFAGRIVTGTLGYLWREGRILYVNLYRFNYVYI